MQVSHTRTAVSVSFEENKDYWLPDDTMNPDWQPTSPNPTEKPKPTNPSKNHNF